MDKENVLEVKPTEPTRIETVEELLKYQKDFDTGFHFTDKEAGVILDILEGHGYELGHVNGELFRGDLEELPNRTVWEEYPMDDVIDMACEWNYELILDIDAERQNVRDFIDFGNKQNQYNSLKAEEQILDSLFEQTKYGRQVENLAVDIAKDIIAAVEADKNVDAVAHGVAESIKQYSAGGKSR